MARIKLTSGRIAAYKCKHGTPQSFLWDSEAPGLAVRATPGDAQKAFVFQGRLRGKSLRVVIGDVRAWDIESGDPIRPGAREEARRLKRLTDQGIDPREEKAERAAQAVVRREEINRRNVIFADAWRAYLDAPHPTWGERYRRDHVNLARLGGEKWKRGKRKTNAGPIAAWMPRPLRELDDPERLKAWLATDIANRATQTRIAFGLLQTFANWCSDTPEYKGIVHPAVFDNRAVRALLPRKGAKKDCLQREQLKVWFAAVRALDNPTASAYLQALLLTGARREELAALTWANVNFKWQSLTIRDKVEGERTIPLTPHVAALLRELQGRNVRPLRLPPGEKWEPSPWVFASPAASSGRIAEPRLPHARALRAAGIEGLTLHGLRRSFGTLAEWVEVPAGIVAQIQGHKPSGTAERHYRVRPLDLLRLWHTRIEAWILNEAGIALVAKDPVKPRALELVRAQRRRSRRA